ncbi:S8 family peptidase [Mobilitalea sibirica]|uniref:S8 family peptidase n=1 Tax=Mobilitalea sibirica TaxID=1462919 RepID=A0A8J7L2E8_9FIRM|nr:S8 family peptidase [Mobilitalea sibirica]MBH1940448.1 S8 family peptidase [Mobilitalea sibirica]
MTPEESFKITSNEYMDLIIDYGGNESILEIYQEYSPHIMNDRFAVIYLPSTLITERTLVQFGYAAFPSSFGLASERSLEASGVTRIRRFPAFDLRGAGVLIGVVDTGIDYTNPIFRNEDGTTRIVSIWDQTIESLDEYPEGTFYGTEYSRDQINEALNSENPLVIVPSMDEIGHGTMMAGIAAGNEVPDRDFSGVVPESELVVVKLKQAKPIIREFFGIPLDVPCYQENDIIWGVQYLISVARLLDRPMAICIGLGSSQGSHNGRGYLSALLSVAANFPGIAISIAAGNEGNKRRHFFSTVDPAIGSVTMELNVSEDEEGFSMELWGAGPNTYSIDILSPTGEYVPRIVESLVVNREISFLFETTRINVDYRMVEAQSGDQLILLRFEAPTTGVWTFQVYSRGDLQGAFHCWLPADEFIEPTTYFLQSNPYTTVTAPGNSPLPITVTAYNSETGTIYLGASRGYTRTDDIKPELAAPGVNIISPTLQQGFDIVTGTGAATAHCAGITAMILEWGILREFYPNITTAEVKSFLIRGAFRNERIQYPNRDWGYGAIDIFNVFNQLRTEI